MNEFMAAVTILIVFVGFCFLALIGFMFYVIEFFRTFGKQISKLTDIEEQPPKVGESHKNK